MFGKANPCGVSGEQVYSVYQNLEVGSQFYSDLPRQVYYLVYIIRSGSLLSWNPFACGTCLGDNCSVELKLEFKKGEDVLEEMQKFCYLGDLISCYGGKSKALSTRFGSAWKEFRELSVVVDGKQGLSLKKWGMIYQ